MKSYRLIAFDIPMPLDDLYSEMKAIGHSDRQIFDYLMEYANLCFGNSFFSGQPDDPEGMVYWLAQKDGENSLYSIPFLNEYVAYLIEYSINAIQNYPPFRQFK